jgi:predicted ester cyclase
MKNHFKILALLFSLSVMMITFNQHVEAQNQTLTEKNKQLVQDFYLSKSLDKADKYLADDFISHMHPKIIDKKSYSTALKNFLIAFPSMTGNIEQIIAEGDIVAIKSSWNGTQKGSYLGNQSTKEPITINQSDLYRVSNGKISEHWGVIDVEGKMANNTFTFG